VAAGLAVGGCLGGSPLVSGGGSTRVESVPSGAEVFVMGERLGITPLAVADARIFPIQYPRELSALYGKVLLRHPGCEDLVRAIDLRATNEGLNGILACGGAAEPSDRGAPASAANPVAAPVPPGADAPRPTEERLAQIEALRRDGLIGAEEAHALRDRVLREVLDDRAASDALRSLESLRAAGAVDDAEYRVNRSAILDRL
jgi:hypothetical protein